MKLVQIEKKQNSKPDETLPVEFKWCIKLQIKVGVEISFNSFFKLLPLSTTSLLSLPVVQSWEISAAAFPLRIH